MTVKRLKDLGRFVPRVPLYYTRIVFAEYAPWNECWELLKDLSKVLDAELQSDGESGAWAEIRIDRHRLEAEVWKIDTERLPDVLRVVESYIGILDSFAANEGDVELIIPGYGLSETGLEEIMSLTVNGYEEER
ncbi:MAG: hypothetical protein A3205_05795 [Methanomassiliicoccales archaeon Mx-03]|nr:MAG: hypothetical protein A3205_05795 [Methanomassiliicoccales archaeon Mx-03]